MDSWKVATGKSTAFGSRKTGRFEWAQYKQEYFVQKEVRQGCKGKYKAKHAFIVHYKDSVICRHCSTKQFFSASGCGRVLL